VANFGFLKSLRRGALSAPNALTLSRLLLTAPICLAIVSKELALALALFLLAGLTDYLDGRIARARHQETGFGKVFDLSTDGLLFLGVLLSLAWISQLRFFWAAALILSGAIPILSQGRLMMGQRHLTTYSDRVGKLCGGATYLSLTIAILGKGVDFFFPLTVSLIYLSVLRDWVMIRRLLSGKSRSQVADSQSSLLVLENDLLLNLSKTIGVTPYGLVLWLVLATSVANIALSVLYGTFWPKQGAASFSTDYRALFIDFIASPMIAMFWARSPRAVASLTSSLPALISNQNATADLTTWSIPNWQRWAWRLTVPVFLPIFELLFYLPVQKITTRAEYYYRYPEFFAVKAFLWVVVHYMIAMFFVNTTPAVVRVRRRLASDATLNIGHRDGVYGLSGIGRFVLESAAFLLFLSLLLAVVFYAQYAQSNLLLTPYSGGLNFVSLWVLPFFFLYGSLLYRSHKLMATFKETLVLAASKALHGPISELTRVPKFSLLTQVGLATQAHEWFKKLPTFPLGSRQLALVYSAYAVSTYISSGRTFWGLFSGIVSGRK